MATYNITKSDGTAGPAIPDASSPDTQTDLQLVGQNAVSYGLDVAQSFYFLLESFAKDTAPAVGGVTGHLWYDKGGVSGTPSLNVWSGSAWQPLASIAVGETADSMARWDNTAKTWTEETQVTLTDAGVLGIAGDTSGQVTFAHDNTDFNIAGTATTDINITGVTVVNMPSLTLTTVLDETYGGTGVITYTTGDILTATGSDVLTALSVGSNGDILTVVSGEPTWAASGAAVSVLDDLTDVTAAGAATGSILVKSAGDWIVATGLSYDDGANDLTVTNIEGIAAVNLISRVVPGTLASTTFSGDILTSNADISLGDNDQVIFGSGNDVRVDFDTTDFVIDAFSGVDFNITNFSGALRVDTAIYSGITGSGGGELKVLGTTNSNSTNEGFVSVNHNDDLQTQIRMGTRSGSSFSEVNALVDDLNLYASNSLVFNLSSTETTATQSGTTTMTLHAVSGNNTSSTMGVFDDSGAERNVGYNETPESVVSTARTIDIDDISKFLTRTGTTSRTITIDNDADIPVGGSVLIHNDNTTGTLTILEGTITSLEWIDGSGSAPSTGTRTIAYNSIVTIRKKSSTEWQIWGNGIS